VIQQCCNGLAGYRVIEKITLNVGVVSKDIFVVGPPCQPLSRLNMKYRGHTKQLHFDEDSVSMLLAS
jgi:site-specific DNA-cytosine methylase